jgi:hypothetical protein
MGTNLGGRLLNADEAAELLGTTRKSLYRHGERWGIPEVRREETTEPDSKGRRRGVRRRWRERALLAWLEQHEHG